MMQKFPDHYAQVNGVKTRYWQAGSGGSAVLLVHGLGSCVETWSCNIAALAQRHRVYALDLVGSGRSDKPAASYALPFLSEFAVAFLDAVGVDRAHWVGNSLGGAIALQTALTQPARVDRLALLNSVGLGREISWSLRLAQLPFAEQLYNPSRFSTEMTLKQVVFDAAVITDEWVETFNELAKLPGAKDALFAQIRSSIDWEGVRPSVYQPILDRLLALTAPTLIAWGKQDSILPLHHAERAAALLPNARLHVFDRCGHWTQVEHAAELNSLLLDFFATAD